MLHVVGTGRSGTTWARSILASHPELHVTKESSFFVVTDEKRWRRDPAAERARYLRSAPFRWLNLPEDAVGAGSSRAQAYLDLVAADAARHGKRLAGDKTPAHWMALDELPPGVVLHMVRDPRAVVASMMTVPWGSPSLVANALWCEAAARKLSREPSVLTVRLEDLATSTRALEPVLEGLGLSWHPQLDEPERFGPDDLGGIPWLVERRSDAPLDDAAREAVVERLCPTVLDAFGYRPRAQATRRAVAAAMAADLPRLVRSGAYLARLRAVASEEPETDLRRWLAHHPEAFEHWPGWDADRVVAATFSSS